MAKERKAGAAKAAKKEWKPLDRAVYAEVLSGLVHFSAKTVNSNTPACGVRLGAGQGCELPYVAVATSVGVPPDYTSTGTNGGNATALAQICAALDDAAAQAFLAIPADEAQTIRALAGEGLDTAFETGTAAVAMRLRQIIVQDAEGNDLALTPLQSAGFSALLDARIEERLAAQEGEHKRYWRRGFLGIGGSNPQNVGRYVRAMGRPLFFDLHDDPATRSAYALHHRGIELAPPPALLREMIVWRRRLLAEAGGIFPCNAATRRQESEFLRAYVAAVQTRAGAARRRLQAAQAKLPDGQLLSTEVDELLYPLFFPAERDADWQRAFAQRLHRTLIDAAVEIDGVKRTLAVGESETAHWVSLIEEAL